MIIEQHDTEANLLRRRLEFLELMDRLLYQGWTADEIKTDKSCRNMLAQFKSVQDPSDVVAGLKVIYGSEES